jgi:hypothetical protein
MHGRYVYKIFDRKCERRRLSERPRCRLDWIWLRMEASCKPLWTYLMYLWVPQKVENFLTSWVNISFSRTVLVNAFIHDMAA